MREEPKAYADMRAAMNRHNARADLAERQVRSLAALNENMRRRILKAVEALTPSGETKAVYIGEFSFSICERDEDGEEHWRQITVPWDTTKQIMAAIKARAGL